MTEREAIKLLKTILRTVCLGNQKFIDAVKKAISALEKQEQNRWIPCSVRPPELESEVLVTDEYGEIRHADYSDWLGKAEFRTVEESMTLEDVKAWRPLPEPYTEEES